MLFELDFVLVPSAKMSLTVKKAFVAAAAAAAAVAASLATSFLLLIQTQAVQALFSQLLFSRGLLMKIKFCHNNPLRDLVAHFLTCR